MKTKNIEKVLLLITVTILLVGLVSAASVNKTSSTTKDTKIVKETKPIKTQESKSLKTNTKKINTTKSTDNKATKKIATSKEANNNISKKIPYKDLKNINKSIKEYSDGEYTVTISSKNHVNGKSNVYKDDGEKIPYIQTTSGTVTVDAKIKPYTDEYDGSRVFVSFWKDTGPSYTGLYDDAIIYDGKFSVTFDLKTYGNYWGCFHYSSSYGELYINQNFGIKYYNGKDENKKVKLNIQTSSNLKTDGSIKISVKALKGTTKVEDGKIRIKFNGKKIAYEKISNSKVSTYHILPNKAGKYTITAEYLKNNEKLATKNKKIKITDSEQMTFQTKSNSKTDSTHTYLVKVRNANGEANKGTVRIKLNGKVIGNKNVKNGIARIEYKMPHKAGTYKATAQFIKYGKLIHTLYININVEDSETMSLTTNTNTLRNSLHKFEVKVTNNYGKVNHGLVRIKLNGKVIAKRNVKNSIVKINYRMPNKPETYKATVEYIKYNKVIKSLSKNIIAKDYRWGSYICGERITGRHPWCGDPNIECLGTDRNIYLHSLLNGKVAKRVLRNGAYYFQTIN